MDRYCFGVDVGGTTVKIGLFNEEENLLHTWEIPTRTEEDGRFILRDIRDAMSGEMAARGLTPEKILGVGIAVPGPVTGGTATYCVNLGWGRTDVAKELSSLFWQLPVRVANDANAAALGEACFGGAKGYRDMVMLTLGTGLGVGIVLNGRILQGSHGAAGETGHAPFYTEAKTPCNCGHTGCLEQIASATGIAHKAKELLEESDRPSVLRNEKTISARAVMDACKAGDPIAMETVDKLVDYLGRGMAAIASVVDPEVFVLGGGVSRTGTWLNERLEDRFDETAPPACKGTQVLPATLGNDAGMYGAAALILSE